MMVVFMILFIILSVLVYVDIINFRKVEIKYFEKTNFVYIEIKTSIKDIGESFDTLMKKLKN